jgi:hypothetical protein
MVNSNHTPNRTWAKPSTVCRVTSWPSPFQATSMAATPTRVSTTNVRHGAVRQAPDSQPRASASTPVTANSTAGGHSTDVSGERMGSTVGA